MPKFTRQSYQPRAGKGQLKSNWPTPSGRVLAGSCLYDELRPSRSQKELTDKEVRLVRDINKFLYDKVGILVNSDMALRKSIEELVFSFRYEHKWK